MKNESLDRVTKATLDKLRNQRDMIVDGRRDLIELNPLDAERILKWSEKMEGELESVKVHNEALWKRSEDFRIMADILREKIEAGEDVPDRDDIWTLIEERQAKITADKAEQDAPL